MSNKAANEKSERTARQKANDAGGKAGLHRSFFNFANASFTMNDLL